MAEEIHYDYQSMDMAYENMKRISSNMQSACQEMMSDAMRLLQSSGGSYADGYEVKQKQLNQQFDELNTTMATRAPQLQERFDHMGQTDVKLGSGF